jgi:hypothetical protein
LSASYGLFDFSEAHAEEPRNRFIAFPENGHSPLAGTTPLS